MKFKFNQILLNEKGNSNLIPVLCASFVVIPFTAEASLGITNFSKTFIN